MSLPIEHKRFGCLEVSFGHQGNFHLVLDVFHTHSIAEAQMFHDVGQAGGVDGSADGGKRLENGTFDFLQ